MDAGVLAARARRVFAALAFVILCAWAQASSAQVPLRPVVGGNWYRGGATLDLDFVHDQYWLNGTNYADNGSAVGTALTNFISGAGATFTRAGTTNVTTTSPPSQSPFFLPSADSFVSRADATPIATYFNSSGVLTTVATAGAGRTAAYTYNGSSWVLGGTLAEPAATNLVNYSTNFSTGWTLQNATVTAGAATAPDGTTTASALIEDTSTNQHDDVNFATSFSLYTTYTFSVFVKSDTGDRNVSILLNNSSGTWSILTVNLSTGIPIGTPTGTSYSVTKLSNGWYRLSTTGQVTGGTYVVGIIKIANGSNVNYTGNGASGIYVWGAQTEASYFPTSYITTSGTAVTRAADVYAVPNGGTYFDNTGTLQQAAVGTARLDYGASGGSNPLGILIEESRTNSIRNNMMVGAVPADGVERTNNGTFSTTSPNVCSGSVTSSTNTLSCNNGSGTGWVGTVNSGSGSVTAGTSTMALTGDGTNAASIYEAIPTVSGYTYTIAVTSGSGNTLTVQAGTSAGASDTYPATNTTGIVTTYFQFRAGSSTSYVQINNLSTTPATVTNISVQSAGKGPTNWGISNSNGSSWDNITVSIVGAGTINGINYVDFKCSGTSSSASQNCAVKSEQATNIAASNGQSWDHSVYAALVGGSTANVSFGLGVDQYNSTPTYVGGAPSGITYTPTSTLMRYSASTTTNNAATAYVQPVMYNTFGLGAVVNFTLRIGMPQLELGPFPTSVIPTYGSAVTRGADVMTIGTSAAGANGPWYTAGVGTLGAAWTPEEISDSAGDFKRIIGLVGSNVNTDDVSIYYQQGTGTIDGSVRVSGTNNLGVSAHGTETLGLNQAAYAFSASTGSIAANGTATVDQSFSGGLPTITAISLMGPVAYQNAFGGWLGQAWYMPTQQPDAILPNLAPNN